MLTGMPVELNKFAGQPLTVSMWPSFSSFVRMRSFAPPHNYTPRGRMMAITPSSFRYVLSFKTVAGLRTGCPPTFLAVAHYPKWQRNAAWR